MKWAQIIFEMVSFFAKAQIKFEMFVFLHRPRSGPKSNLKLFFCAKAQIKFEMFVFCCKGEFLAKAQIKFEMVSFFAKAQIWDQIKFESKKPDAYI